MADQSGTDQLMVTVHEGSVWIDVERRHEVDQLWAAAEAALMARGFVVTDRSGRLDEPMRIAGVMGGAKASRRAEVSVLVGPRFVRLHAGVKPWGNDAEARAILKRTLELLGYARRELSRSSPRSDR